MFEYQKAGVQFLLEHEHALLADEQGLGKSKMVIDALAKLKSQNVLIVCPAIARMHWVEQFKRWAPGQFQVVIFEGVSGVHCPGTVSVMSYGALSVPSQLHRAIVIHDYDVLVVDEAHFVKGISARAQAIYGGQGAETLTPLVQKAERVWLLTGTPAPNHVGELYNAVSALYAQSIVIKPAGHAPRPMTREEFLDRYCIQKVTQHGPMVTGSRNVTDLRKRLAGFILRRRKAQVLKQLPPLRVVHTPLDVYGWKAETVVPKLDQRWRLALGDIDVKKLAPAELLALLREKAGDKEIASIRRLTGLTKVQMVVELAQLLLLQREKVVIFAHHIAVLNALTAGLNIWQPVLINGNTNGATRATVIDRFQTDPKCRVFIGSLTAAGTAITLTAASNVLFAEYDWTPATNLQAAARCHRIGQNAGVLAQLLYLPDSMDEHIARVLARKSEDLKLLLD